MNKTCDTCGTIWCKALDVCRTCREGEREREGVGVEGLESRWQRAWTEADVISGERVVAGIRNGQWVRALGPQYGVTFDGSQEVASRIFGGTVETDGNTWIWRDEAR